MPFLADPAFIFFLYGVVINTSLAITLVWTRDRFLPHSTHCKHCPSRKK